MTVIPVLPELLLSSRHQDRGLWRQVHTGELERIRRGAYAAAQPELDGLTRALLRARLHIQAVAEQSQQDLWFSHQSAALLHGLPTRRVPDVTHVIQRQPPSARNDPRVRRHHMRLTAQEQDEVDGFPVTSLERTVLDCARGQDIVEAVMILDAYLNGGGSRTRLAEMLADLAGRRGVRLARRHLDWADGGSESPGETRTRVVLLKAGLRPQTQVPVTTGLGHFRLDMGWPERRVGLEYDGKVKYTRLAHGDPAEVVFQEKVRQDAIEAAGWSVLRVTAQDLRQPQELVAAVRERLSTPRK